MEKVLILVLVSVLVLVLVLLLSTLVYFGLFWLILVEPVQCSVELVEKVQTDRQRDRQTV